jgi:hypothetical protein
LFFSSLLSTIANTFSYVSFLSLYIFSVLLIIGYIYNVGIVLIVSVFGYGLSTSIGVGPIPWMSTYELARTYASFSVGAAGTAMN